MISLRIACRPSPLALAQFAEFAALVPWMQLRLVPTSSPGDRERHTSLLAGGAPGDFFTRDLDHAIRDGQADAALHSAKDLPWPLPPDLAVWALGPRHDPHDSLVSRPGWTIDTLPSGALVGTSSASRAAALTALRPDLRIVPIRGTIAERIALLDQPSGPNGEPRPHAVVVARCALRRLGLDEGQVLPFEAHPLQGHLALTGLLADRRMARAFADIDARKGWGRVSIAGAGPGRADLLSALVARRLADADIIFYDALLDPAILDGLKAETVFVGKRMGHHVMKQDEINRRLHQAALAGKRVVRLKGGDPLILGRGSEEAAFLGERLVDYEILPGISAAQGAAAFAEIPLTERGRASSWAAISGYPADRLQWSQADTQAFYMAGSALDRLATLSGEHQSSETALAAVQGATSPWQKVTRGSYGKATSLVSADQDSAPVLYLGGPTVDERAGNGWFDRLPRVLHTGTDPGTEAKAVHVPYIFLQPRPLSELSAEETSALSHPATRYDWLAFTSRQTVRCWFSVLASLKLDARSLAGLRIAAIGHSTAAALREQGIRVDLVPAADQEHSQGLVAALAHEAASNNPAAGRILLPRSSSGLALLPDLLRRAGFTVTPLVLYHNQPRRDPPGVTPENFDEIVFTSPSTVEAFRTWHPAIPARVLVRLRGPQSQAAFTRLYPDHPDARKEDTP